MMEEEAKGSTSDHPRPRRMIELDYRVYGNYYCCRCGKYEFRVAVTSHGHVLCWDCCDILKEREDAIVKHGHLEPNWKEVRPLDEMWYTPSCDCCRSKEIDSNLCYGFTDWDSDQWELINDFLLDD